MDALIPALAANGGVRREPCVTIREPDAEDGAAIADLIARCPPLDRNSVYSTLLLCSHFARTCALAEEGGRVMGWVSGYVLPDRDDTLFVWQVAVGPEGRGQGLATRMITNILARPVCTHVRKLQTTITFENEPSWALFRRLAAGLRAGFAAEPHFMRRTHFAGGHATEHLVTLDPVSHHQ